MKIEYKIIENEEIYHFQNSLHELEQQFTYPLQGSEDQFFIGHGNLYHKFFAKQGEPIFVLALLDGNVIGILSLILKNDFTHNKKNLSLYLCDLKISKCYRGNGIAKILYHRAFSYLLKKGIVMKLPFSYFVAMQNEKGDFAKNSKQSSWLSMFQQMAEVQIFFVSPKVIGDCTLSENFEEPMKPLLLSKTVKEDVINMKGIKDIILCSSEEVLPLYHVNCKVLWGFEYFRYLKHCASLLADDATLCFAIDSRRVKLIETLNDANIYASGFAKVYCTFWQKLQFGNRIVFIGTNEI